jgi:hypothetical protein
MRTQDEEVKVPDEVLAEVKGGAIDAQAFNEGVRESALVVANVDKGFTHCIKHFRNDREVIASIQGEQGRHGEYGWGVCFEQGRHRCILAGSVANRPAEEVWEDTLWTACAGLP